MTLTSKIRVTVVSFLYHWLFFLYLTPLSTIFQPYHGNQFYLWKKPEFQERTTDHGQTTSKLYHLQLLIECTLFCNLQSQAWTHVILVIGLYELLGNQTTQLIEPPLPFILILIIHHVLIQLHTKFDSTGLCALDKVAW